MALSKTEKAAHALQSNVRGELSLPDRRVLILADGKRSGAEIMRMLGNDAARTIDRLLSDGYLVGAGGDALLRRDTSAPRDCADDRAIAAPANGAGLPPATARRSIAATKMYMLDMLQLQRGPQAAEFVRAIARAADPDALIDVLLDALRYILSASSVGYGARVAERFSEIAPDAAVPKVEAIRRVLQRSDEAAGVPMPCLSAAADGAVGAVLVR